jgi:cytochrome c oxidase subunit 2
MLEFLARWMPPDYSVHGAELDKISAYVHWLMLILFVVWGALIAFMLFRFRASRQKKASYHGLQSHVTTWGEIGVVVLEVILLVGFSIPAWSRWTTTPGKAANPMEIRVIGEQFAWNIHYPGADGVFGRTDVKLVTSSNPLGIDVTDPNAKDDVATINQLHLEVNRPIIIHISSKDVIHSFSLPVMRVKQDATPGMTVPVHFTATKSIEEGETWEIGCAQLCGLGHYRMKGMLFVHDKATLAKWLAEQPTMEASSSS